MDWAGIALLTMSVATLQYLLEEGQKDDWFQSATIRACAAVAAIATTAFIIRERTAKVPAVNLSLFKDPVFTSGTLVGAVMFMMLMSITFLLPVFMQELLGFTAVQSGVALMPRSLSMMVAMPIVGRIYNTVSPRLTVAVGVLLFTITSVMMSHYTLDTSQRDVMGVLILQGVAFACLFIPLTTVALSRIPRHKLADATGLNSLLRQIGGSLGLAIFATLMPRYATQAAAAIGTHVDPTRPEVFGRVNAMTHQLQMQGMDYSSATRTADAMLAGMVGRQAGVLMYERLFMLSGIMFLVVLPLLYFLKSPDHDVPNAAPAPKVDVHVEV